MTAQRALLVLAPFFAAFAAGTYFGLRPSTPAVPAFTLTAAEKPRQDSVSFPGLASSPDPAPEWAKPDVGVRFVERDCRESSERDVTLAERSARRQADRLA